MGEYPWYVLCNVSYLYGERFQALRGEELLGSYSSWGDGSVLEERSVLQGRVSYTHILGYLAQCNLMAEAFYDLNLGRVDWAFELSLRLRWRTH
ncbi:MAG: hypothetical protein CSA97_04950 [Bacteroidetes bacterium]|nr:MAG: hypothetical protein CSA97_04950 [Bacteroidota bacterium]